MNDNNNHHHKRGSVIFYTAEVLTFLHPHADKTKNRGFAFVEYENHRAAAMARRKLNLGRIQLWGHQIAVDWAEPEQDVDEEIMVTVSFVALMAWPMLS